jgi:hypothetical protein
VLFALIDQFIITGSAKQHKAQVDKMAQYIKTAGKQINLVLPNECSE